MKIKFEDFKPLESKYRVSVIIESETHTWVEQLPASSLQECEINIGILATDGVETFKRTL